MALCAKNAEYGIMKLNESMLVMWFFFCVQWVDKEGRTPLILACTRGDLLDMVSTLLTLGANLKAYRPGV